MSRLSQFFGGALSRVPTTLIGSNSTAAATVTLVDGQHLNLRTVLAGSLTANVYSNLVTLTGPGVLNFAAIARLNAAGTRSVYMKVTLDGNQVIERSSLSTTVQDCALPAIGDVSSGGDIHCDAIPFSSSCVIAVKSSNTETDQIKLFYRARQ